MSTDPISRPFPASLLTSDGRPDVSDINTNGVIDDDELRASSAERLSSRLKNSVDYVQTDPALVDPSQLPLAQAAQLVAALPDDQLARLFGDVPDQRNFDQQGDTSWQAPFTNALFKAMGDKAVARYTHIVELMRWNPGSPHVKQERLAAWVGQLEHGAYSQVMGSLSQKNLPEPPHTKCMGLPHLSYAAWTAHR